MLNIGTASQLILRKAASLTNEPPLPESVMKVPYFNDDYLLVVAALGGGNVISTFVRTVQSWLQELGMECGETEMYEKLMQAALNKCNTSLRVIPKLWGERHTPEERGQVLNIRPDNISLGDVGSAMVRGVVENLHTMMTLQVLQDYQVHNSLHNVQYQVLTGNYFTCIGTKGAREWWNATEVFSIPGTHSAGFWFVFYTER